MEKNNIFVVGSEVYGDSMIGYKEHLNRLVDVIKILVPIFQLQD